MATMFGVDRPKSLRYNRFDGMSYEASWFVAKQVTDLAVRPQDKTSLASDQEDGIWRKLKQPFEKIF
jgi:hypothetical protein